MSTDRYAHINNRMTIAVNTSKEESVTPIQVSVDKPVDEQVRSYAAEDLFQGSKKIIIRYANSNYELRITKKSKLILTK